MSECFMTYGNGLVFLLGILLAAVAIFIVEHMLGIR